MLIPLPDNVPWDTAPIAEPLVIALHGLHRGALKAGEHAAIIGAGPIGLLAAMAAKALGAVPILLDVVDARLEFARDCGIQFTIIPCGRTPWPGSRISPAAGWASWSCECSGANAAIRSTPGAGFQCRTDHSDGLACRGDAPAYRRDHPEGSGHPGRADCDDP